MSPLIDSRYVAPHVFGLAFGLLMTLLAISQWFGDGPLILRLVLLVGAPMLVVFHAWALTRIYRRRRRSEHPGT